MKSLIQKRIEELQEEIVLAQSLYKQHQQEMNGLIHDIIGKKEAIVELKKIMEQKAEDA